MSTITLPNIRVSSDLEIRLKLKDGGVAIDWTTLSNIKATIYSDRQRSLAGRCDIAIDEDDATVLVCRYSANKPQYIGVNRIVISATYLGEMKTYDKPALNFVRWTDDQAGQSITIDDPDIDVEITVEDVSSSILQEAVEAANSAAERANDAAAAAEHMVDIHTGPAGKSAYEVAVEEGYTGTEEEWLASLKGPVGETPDISIGTVTTVEPGTPAAANMTGTPEAPVLNLTIPKGVAGDTPAFTVGEVTTGQPGTPVVVTITGTAAAPVLNIQIPQGLQGNPGSSVDYPFELVNNATTNDATKAATAAVAKGLKDDITQLEAEVGDLTDLQTQDKTSVIAAINEVSSAEAGTEAEVAIIKSEAETGMDIVPVSPTEITSLSIGTSGITFNSSTSASSVYYIPVTKGQHIFYKASSSSSKVLRFAFCLDVPAEDVVFTGVERYNLASYDYERIAPFDGYFAVYHLNNALSNQEFKVGTPTALGQRVVALEESSAESEEFREGSIVDKTSSFIGGYYNMADKSQGDLLRPFASSEIYYTAKIAIKKGQVVRCNTEYMVTSSIRHCLITDDNRLVEYVTRASVNDGYTISDEAIAAGGVYLLVVYNADTQLKPISLTISDTYGFIQEEIRKNDGAKLYADKSVILCGDSILGQAQGVDGMIQDIIGGNILNCGFGGCRMSWRTADGSSPWDAFTMVNIADCLVSGNFTSMESQTDIIESYPYFATAINKLKSVAMTDGKDVVLTIAYGANDFTGNALLGNLNDEDKTTYIGALGYAVDKLMTAFPRLVILIVSTWYRVFDYDTDPVTEEKTIVTDSDNKVRSDGETSAGFNNALKSASETLKLPFFDVYHRGGINKYNIFTLRPDGTHPTTSAGKHSEAEVYSKILQTF